MNFGYNHTQSFSAPRDLTMQQHRQYQQQAPPMQAQQQMPSRSVNNGVPLEIIKAKRREVEQKLEALLALRGVTTTFNDTDDQANATTWTSTNYNNGADVNTNLDSNDWMTFANLMEPGSLSVPNTSTMPPLQPEQPEPAAMSSTTARLLNAENFVLSDRLAEILPELEVNYEVPNEEDHNGLIQFFADGDAWLNSNKPNSAMSAPSLTHNVSVVSDTSSGSASTGSVSSRSHTPPTTTRKKRSKANSANGSKRKLGRPSAFPQKLYTMLTSVPQQDAHLAHIVSFTPDGSAFEIHDNEAFVEAILPKYFKMSSFSSFQRQLQLYNFKRVSKGGAYRHPLFHRDQPDHLAKMARKQSKPSTFVLSLSN